MTLASEERVWEFGGFQYVPTRQPLFMGIVNVTPDSFSDGGNFLSVPAAVDHALRLTEEGADILDVGGESTRPGANVVDPEEELRRVIPVIENLAARVTVPISIDTCKPEVARRALQAGARIVNDIAGLRDPLMVDVCQQSDCGIICMHMQGTPRTMQIDPRYEDVVSEIRDYLAGRLATLASTGIDPRRIALDPGIGFGKSAHHNMQILRAIREFQLLGRPVLIGHSRKRFLQKVIGRTVDERLYGTLGVSVALAHQGIDILRVHDVGPNRDAVLAYLATTVQ